MEPSSAPARRRLGLLALVFYGLAAGAYLARGEPWNVLWACHLACVAIGAGLIFGSPTANAIGLLWLSVGLPMWLYGIAPCVRAIELLPTSIFTHVGGAAVGLWGARALGVPRRTTVKAIAALVALQLACRWLTPPQENVNMSFAPWSGLRPYFPNYPSYFVANLVLVGAVFAAAETLARRLRQGAGPWAK